MSLYPKLEEFQKNQQKLNPNPNPPAIGISNQQETGKPLYPPLQSFEV